MGYRAREERGTLGTYLPMGTRAEPHVDTNRPEPWNALGQVCIQTWRELLRYVLYALCYHENMYNIL